MWPFIPYIKSILQPWLKHLIYFFKISCEVLNQCTCSSHIAIYIPCEYTFQLKVSTSTIGHWPWPLNYLIKIANIDYNVGHRGFYTWYVSCVMIFQIIQTNMIFWPWPLTYLKTTLPITFECFDTVLSYLIWAFLVAFHTLSTFLHWVFSVGHP